MAEVQLVDKRMVAVDNQWDMLVMVGDGCAEAISILQKEQIQAVAGIQTSDTRDERGKADIDIDAAADTGLRLVAPNRREEGVLAVDRHSREDAPDGDRRLRSLDRRPILTAGLESPSNFRMYLGIVGYQQRCQEAERGDRKECGAVAGNRNWVTPQYIWIQKIGDMRLYLNMVESKTAARFEVAVQL